MNWELKRKALTMRQNDYNVSITCIYKLKFIKLSSLWSEYGMCSAVGSSSSVHLPVTHY